MRTLARLAVVSTIAVLGLVVASPAALACGGLVGENGTIQLGRTTTLAAYHDGIERYVTSFEFTGEGEELGSIVPLPGIPTKVERGGDWTLQRLQLEVAPPIRLAGSTALAANAAEDSARVILETKIDALDITILEGGGTAVGKWATDNGFFLTPDAPEVLEAYSQRSPIFMAAKFDARAARDLGQNRGDGTPIMLTIPTDRPWVPLRILGLGLEAEKQIQADIFLLTDGRPQLLAGRSGLTLARSENASESLLVDLRSDKGMEWVPDDMWLTYLQLDTPAGNLTYDLATAITPKTSPRLADAGFLTAPNVGAGRSISLDQPSDYRWLGVALLASIVVGLTTAATVSVRRRYA